MSIPKDSGEGNLTHTQPTLEQEEASDGRTIGSYRIVRELGRGGMGEVFLAARADDQYRKRVAIKLVRTGYESDDMLRHFRRERQVLAGLDHPNIARLLDGGATRQGRPYLVMDYVEGMPIDQYCETQGLSLVERLKLFQSVCAAVSHAHCNLVVHRDIKPSNILVTQDGTPKLMDFGLAKLLNPDLARETATGTRFAFTPAYASREQVRGEPVTTATDVYSLGVVLYELMTGRSPYRVKTQSSVEVLNAVCEQEPERPSTAILRKDETLGASARTPTEPATEEGARLETARRQRLRRRLQGDLDAILLRALRKEPHRRYPSVGAFSEDIGRYLEGRPVAARKGTLTYRAGKFVRRHWAGVAAVVLTFAALLVAGLMATFGLVRAREAEGEAVREAAKATAINDFLQSTMFSAHPSLGGGREITLLETLAGAVGRIDTSFPEQPEIRAAVQNTIGRTYADLGLFDEAERLFDQSLATRRELLGAEHPDVAETLHDLGALHMMRGSYDLAESLQRDALAMRRRLLGEEALPVAETMNDLAITLQAGKADYEAALPFLEQSLAIKRARLGDRDRDVAKSLNNLGMLYYRKEDLARAEALLQEGLALNRELLGDDHIEVASGLNNLGLVQRTQGDYAAAVEHFEQALETYGRVLGPQHPRVGNGLNNLAATLMRAGRHREAEQRFREALEIHRHSFPRGHFQISTTESLLGGCLAESGRHAEAEPLLTAAYAVIERQFGPDHPRTEAARKRVVELYTSWGKPDKAAAYEG